MIATRTSIQARPISDGDLGRVAEFLHANLNQRIPAADWLASVDVPWAADRPNAGFMLLDGDRVVGANVAIYSERVVRGRRERFCNLAAWCVLPEYRLHSLKLVRALLAQEDLHFTDFSPSERVVALNEKLGFRRLDTSASWVPNLPWPSLPGRVVVSSDPQLIERTLTGRDLEVYRDHARAPAARHLVLLRGDEWCYVMLRKNRRWRQPVIAALLYVSHPRLLARMWGPLARTLLLRHGALVTLAERRVAGWPPRLSWQDRAPRPRMFRSSDLGDGDVDYLYSEQATLKW